MFTLFSAPVTEHRTEKKNKEKASNQRFPKDGTEQINIFRRGEP